MSVLTNRLRGFEITCVVCGSAPDAFCVEMKYGERTKFRRGFHRERERPNLGTDERRKLASCRAGNAKQARKKAA